MTAELQAPQTRKIIHCDCDSFYASVEMRDNPRLRDRPVAVGGRPEVRGVVATCNYEARRYGIHSAMPTGQALRACPDLIVIPPDMAKYRVVSSQIRDIFARYTSLIEPLSLDEAYLDVSSATRFRGSATLIAEDIRSAVRSQLGITISAGIAPNKFLAKIASDWNKPDGQFTIEPSHIAAFVAALPIEKIFGVGQATAARLHARGITTCLDLQEVSLGELIRDFGTFGARLHQLCRGEDARPVQPNRIRKSISVERTYVQDIQGVDACLAELDELFEELDERILSVDGRSRVSGCFVKVKFDDFQSTTASSTATATSLETFQDLLRDAWWREKRAVRLIGLGVRLRAPHAQHQIELFAPTA